MNLITKILSLFFLLAFQNIHSMEESINPSCLMKEATLKTALDDGLDRFQRYKNKQTLLHIAAKYEKQETMKVLLTYKWPSYSKTHIHKSNYLRMKDDYKNNTLHLMAKSKNFDQEFINYILSLNPDKKAKNKQKQTPLHIAAENDNGKMMTALLGKFKIDEIPEELNYVNTQDKKGNTALHVAAKKSLYLASILLKHKDADLQIKNYKNKTPLELAIKKLKLPPKKRPSNLDSMIQLLTTQT